MGFCPLMLLMTQALKITTDLRPPMVAMVNNKEPVLWGAQPLGASFITGCTEARKEVKKPM